MCTKTLLWAKFSSTFLNQFTASSKEMNCVTWSRDHVTVIKDPCKEVPSSTKLLFGCPVVSGVIWQNTHFKPWTIPWQPMGDPSTDHKFKSFFVRNAPRILVLQSVEAALVPGWWMGSLQNAIWGCCHQLSNICLQRHDNCQSTDTYRHDWNKASPLQRKGGRQHLVFSFNVTRDLLLSMVKYLSSISCHWPATRTVCV